jgi:uncharacterized protein YcfL
MPQTQLVACLGFALLCSLAACDTVKAPRQPGADGIPNGTYPRNVTLDRLDRGVVVGRAVVTPSDRVVPMAVQQAIRSTADYDLNVQYRFEFFDAQGLLLAGGDSWRFQSLPPRMEVFLTGAAVDPKAVDWRLVIRSAR